MATIEVVIGKIGTGLTVETVERFQQRVKEQGGVFGQLGYPEPKDAGLIDPEKISHKVESVRVVGDEVIADITPMRLFNELMETKATVFSIGKTHRPKFGSRGYKRDKELTILTYDFLGIEKI